MLVDNEGLLEKVWNLLIIEEKINYLQEGYYALEFFQEGMDAAILTLGSKSWKKGKLKLSLCIKFYAVGEIEQTKETPEIKEP
ncbi:KGK domain-containing protein [Trichormus azollae]|uniref:KGK domain-containing protein n=1 Tax=Trichormus azollae TaxID=1164 RepID=UPI001E2EF52D|nr:KGK domain-containing protein [Trichormus azollae]